MDQNCNNYICPSCGNAILSDDVFCMHCGAKVELPKPEPETSHQSVCQKCGMPLLEDDAFCMYCGTKVEIPIVCAEEHSSQVCKECGSPILDDDVFCMNCGAKLGNGEPVIAIVLEEIEEQTDEPEPQAAVDAPAEDEVAEEVETIEEVEPLNEEVSDEPEQEQGLEDILDEPFVAPVIVVDEPEEATEIPEEPVAVAADEVKEIEQPEEVVVPAVEPKRKNGRKVFVAIAALVVVVLLGFGGYTVWQSGQDTATVSPEEPVPTPTVTEDEPEELLTPEPINSAEPNVEVSPEPSKEPDPLPSPEQSEATGEQVGTDAEEKPTSTPQPTPYVEPTPEVTPMPTPVPTPTPMPTPTPASAGTEIELPIVLDQSNVQQETGTTFEKVTALVTDDKVIHFKVYYTVGETFNVELSNTPPSTGKLAYTDLGSVEPGSGTISFDLPFDTMAPGGFAVHFRNEEHYTWVGVGPEGTNVIYQSSGYSAPAPAPEPTPTLDFPIDTPVSLKFDTKYIGRDGEPSEGITYTGLTAVKAGNGTVTFTVSFEAEQNFDVTVFDPSGENNTWMESGSVSFSQNSYSFSISGAELLKVDEISINFRNGAKGRVDNGSEINTNWLFIPKSVMNQIRNQ